MKNTASWDINKFSDWLPIIFSSLQDTIYTAFKPLVCSNRASCGLAHRERMAVCHWTALLWKIQM